MIDLSTVRLLVSIATGDNKAAAIQAIRQLIKHEINLEDFIKNENKLRKKLQ